MERQTKNNGRKNSQKKDLETSVENKPLVCVFIVP